MLSHKKSFLLMLLFVMTSGAVKPFEDFSIDSPALTIIKPLVAIGCVGFVISRIAKTEIFESIVRDINLHPKDVSNTLALYVMLVACSIMAEKDKARAAYALSCKLPVAAVVNILYFTQTCQNVLRKIPLVGGITTCPQQCNSICNDCRLTKNIIQLGIWKAVSDSGYFDQITTI
jgi:hypothetical protein